MMIPIQDTAKTSGLFIYTVGMNLFKKGFFLLYVTVCGSVDW